VHRARASRQARSGRISAALVAVLVLLIQFYQRIVSVGMRPRCRFTPSCSCYAIESLQRHGVVKGLARSIWRICRCNPLGKPGYDPP